MDQFDFNTEGLPEFYVTDDGQKVAAPTYEAVAPCYMVMTSAETGITGPSRVEPGEHFTSEKCPCDAWRPLNRAAGENYQRWKDSLPIDSKGIPQELITEAAYTLRPREGEPEIPHEQWWAYVMRLAATLRDKRRGSFTGANAKPPSAYRPGGAPPPVMSFASTGGIMPQPGAAPTTQPAMHQPQNAAHQAARTRKQQVTPPMAGTQPPVGAQGS